MDDRQGVAQRTPAWGSKEMGNGDGRTELRRTWESAAPGWARWEHVLAQGLADVTDAMLDMAGVDAGMRVLDLACGAGSQSLRAAARVGTNGRVVASDISATMLSHVRETARRGGLGNIETLECAAEEIPATAGLFDAAISRLGLMLFPAPKQALKAVQRVLKPGARIAALVFTMPSANPFMSLPMQILLRHAGKAAPAAGKPGIFALGTPGVLEALFADSGLAEVEARVARASLRLASAAQALEMMQQAFGAYRAIVVDLSPEARAAAWSEVGECLRQFEDQEGFQIELEFVIAAGATGGEAAGEGEPR
jgi:ubiquinone/menaquinone biosynthesis C-methylase UbiE